MQFKSGYTKVENYFFDYVMPRVSCAEWKTICAVLRETVGWNRQDAEITLDRFMQLTGFAREAMCAAVRRAVGRSVVQRRTVQNGRQRTFKYRAIEKANLKVLPKREPRRRQEALPFDVLTSTEFENRTASRSSEIELPTPLTEFDNRTPNVPVLIIDLKKEDLRERHTHATTNPASVEKSTASQCVRGSKFTRKQIREYAWASHNFDSFLVDYYTTRDQPKRATVGIKNPDGWATVARRTGEHDDEIQEWLDDPTIFDTGLWLQSRRRA